ncbi:mitochondrial carrier protein [Trypanosoma equiperdum]|uniref:Mitochondrial carrier protein, putative n=3 Tax=Trypanozoon TaxID=39700 RepID=Q387M4_TRYB2|nr:mitochondrial carrier protein, putative [Trypanosoma brucei gambiense DAL972]XP_828119.1 mitochondrial carrier protein, putative [Trypanosoma brucei brucei TREU927]EAN79007.1 mitochondrial carrier protein, putative [Trypanosoma brucei brucei TREU927]CBH16900.1 mitochondrial carrier protein, putative [Trypanosoma brucei gambiense DAL972]SCU67766.1 mitochondrial carrier protein [Trypanosoma equiperdum]|eukprot:XP_011779164.1 mitochondrial carrier protein, putative [Trypanosoma brucei gambiense DAL972]
MHDGNFLKEVTAGSVGGALATIVEYPLDTIKVRLQDDPHRYRGSLSCIIEITRSEGIFGGFFRGLPLPVIGAAVENATLFATYREAIGPAQDLFYRKRCEPDTEPYLAVFTAAAIGGIVVSHVLTPAELIKCKMQVQNTLPEEKRIYKNSAHCVTSIYRSSGIRGLFKGHVSMIMREALGCGMYFSTFQLVIRNMLQEGQVFTDASPFVHFLGGGCAGVVFWTSIYPIDVLKTKVQTNRSEYGNLSITQGLMRLYKIEGMRGLIRGYGVTAIRAFPGNAVLIAAYEQVNRIFEAQGSTNKLLCVCSGLNG